VRFASFQVQTCENRLFFVVFLRKEIEFVASNLERKLTSSIIRRAGGKYTLLP
jgi:hypothetical protein